MISSLLGTVATSHSPAITASALLTVTTPGLGGLSSDTFLADLLRALVFIANLAGGIIVGVGTIRGLVSYIVELFRERGGEVPKEGIRLGLGRSLALALEFQLGADILGTALNPSQRDIEILAAIVILRTVLNFFLQRELREAAKREGELGTIDETRPEPQSLSA